MANSTNTKQPWWRESIVYQIYPSSFLSTKPKSNSHAVVGDIRGIISKVPYIASLGFDTIWLSPIFASPQTDMGYDVSDYRSIHPPFGTVEDVQELIETLHQTPVPGYTDSRCMKLLMDLVVNHTSDQHLWFLQSKSSAQNEKSDWYFWRPPRINRVTGEREEPTNWKSIFGGPAWHYVPERDEYYLALFLPTQPDLNWEVEAVRQAVYDDMRWWLDRGIDGWRIDSMNLMSKHPDLPDAEISEPGERYQDGKKWYASGPRIHEYLQEMRKEVFDRYDAFTVGELGSVESVEGVSRYVAKERNELDCVFAGMDLDFGPGGKYDGSDPFHVSKLRQVTEKWQLAMPQFHGWNSIYLDNHDSGRSLSRYVSDEPRFREAAAKMLATFLMTLSGTPFVLMGQEIGMANLGTDFGIEHYVDVEAKNWVEKVRQDRGHGADLSDVLEQLQLKARDHGRSLMQWDDGANGGFCDEGRTPWIVVNPDHKEWNVRAQESRTGSVLAYWRRLSALRHEEKDLFVYGGFEMLSDQETGEDVIGYERSAPNKQAVVLLSFSEQMVSLSGSKYAGWKRLIGNMDDQDIERQKITLRAYETVVLVSHS